MVPDALCHTAIHPPSAHTPRHTHQPACFLAFDFTHLSQQAVQLAGAQAQLGQAAVGGDAQHRLLQAGSGVGRAAEESCFVDGQVELMGETPAGTWLLAVFCRPPTASPSKANKTGASSTLHEGREHARLSSYFEWTTTHLAVAGLLAGQGALVILRNAGHDLARPALQQHTMTWEADGMVTRLQRRGSPILVVRGRAAKHTGGWLLMRFAWWQLTMPTPSSTSQHQANAAVGCLS